MAATVDDFMRRFGGGGTMDESDAAQYHDRFVSNRPGDRDFDKALTIKPPPNTWASCPMINFIRQRKMP